jgi:hypothetical protein
MCEETENFDGNLFTAEVPADWEGCDHLDCLPTCSYARGHCGHLALIIQSD